MLKKRARLSLAGAVFVPENLAGNFALKHWPQYFNTNLRLTDPGPVT